MSNRSAVRTVAAALALLLATAALGLGPGRHTCKADDPLQRETSSPGLHAMSHADDRESAPCSACKLSSVSRSLGARMVSGIVAPRESGALKTPVHPGLSSPALPARSARAPPDTSPL